MELTSDEVADAVDPCERVDAKSANVTLGSILSDPDDLLRTYKTRNSESELRRIPIADIGRYQADGWSVTREQKRIAYVSKRKPINKYLEDRVWCLFRDMGYPFLNETAFKITFSRQNNTKGLKFIDILAKDEETVAVIECKSRDIRGRKSLQKDISDTASLKKPIANAIRERFGANTNPKILWIYVTENIVWSESDVARASEENIRIITENELDYFETFIAHVGSAGRYQFLAEFLKGQEIPGLSGFKVPAVKGRLGGHTFYSFTISAGHLLKIAFVNHHALNNPEGTPAYQRMVDKKRLSGIGKFIQQGGYFPTNILVNFSQECSFEPLAKSDQEMDGIRFGHLLLPNKYKSAWVIDGQHRLLGFTNLDPVFLNRPLFVVAFEQMETEKEAELFITINHKQKSVPPALLAALQADLQMGSTDPEEALSALASFLIRKLSADSTSPLYGRFQLPGMPPSEQKVLTIPEVQKGLKRSQLLGRVVKGSRIGGYLSASTDAKTLERSRRAINGYFRMIEEAAPERWTAGRSAYLATNPGIRAHLLLFNEILRFEHGAGKIDPALASVEEIVQVVANFAAPMTKWLKSATDSALEERFARRYGEGGVREYFYNLCDLLAGEYVDFGPEEYREYRARAKDERISQAKLDVEDMTKLISRIVVEKLKSIYGTDELPSGEKKYWELGIIDSKIKEDAYKAQQQAKPEKRAPREAYLHIIDFEKIIRQKGTWEHLKPIFSIPLRGVPAKSKEYHLDWIKEFSDIRNVASHSSIYRKVSDDDLEYLAWLKATLHEKCENAGVMVD